MEEYTEWGEEVQRKMFQIWEKNLGEEYGEGFEVFTSPVVKDASVIFIGTKPGSRKQSDEQYHPLMRNKFLKGDFSTPDSHDYVNDGADYPVAKAIRNQLFVNREKHLADSVETNYYFIRTKREQGHSELKSEMGDVWSEYKKFCKDTIEELINKTDPDLIVAFSLGTYDKLVDDRRYETVDIDTHMRPIESDRNLRLIEESLIDGRQLIGLCHPTYWGEEDKQKVRELAHPIIDSALSED